VEKYELERNFGWFIDDHYLNQKNMGKGVKNENGFVLKSM
jgi:hypothetical protein